jgi:hypothetical protein
MISIGLRSMLLALAFVVGLTPAKAGSVQQWGGSDYVFVDTDPEQLHDPDAMRDNSRFHTPPCEFDARADAVKRDLAAMRASGQRKLGLMVWFTHVQSEQDCKGFLANSAGGRLAPRVDGNLERLVSEAGKEGFDEVQIRFAPMGPNWPKDWPAWNEDMYRENWGVIRSTVAALLQIKGPRLRFDLGVEGVARGESDAYIHRLWGDYSKTFPPASSYGFSVAMAPGRVSRLLRDMRESGPAPTELALDIYQNPGRALATAAREMHAEGVDIPIIIQETFYNDAGTYQELRDSARDNNVRLRTIMQWPLKPGPMIKFTEQHTPGYVYGPD